MTLILSGTDNSVSSPAVQGGTGGTTTGVYYPATNQLALATNGTQAVLVDSSQNVGVGTNSPTARFTVVTGSSANNEGTIRVSDNATYYGELKRVNSSDELRLGAYGTAQSLTFYTVASERMRINASGNVGIGQTSPSFRLDVAGPTGTNGDAVRNMELFDTQTASAGSGGGIAFGGYYSGTSSVINDFASIQGFKENSTAGDYAGALRFTTRANGGSPTERVRIDSSGNLNIKTANAGIVFNNSSATTNSTLNDYEYGTYTVTDASGAGLTLTTNRAYYVKVGRNVYISASVNYPSNSSGSQVKMSIPFNSAINTYYAGNGATGYTNYSTVITLPIIENGGVNVLFNKNPSMSGLLNSDLSGLRIDYTVSYVGSF